ncbi:lysophospholipid acyltransferase family protein [Paracoccus aminophilus]|uniref:Phospholipid/glycerol acyltransferase n=1 Tax=Paracoccus aminophilus JCM 7686 TaxID=1367847 RepID=S5XKB2_PARAH|nr:1-acyl-sn-glycerol-3-phosphate acyltransferase [Paracoccus aminophilus]AGT07634.1 phospholipid/glycerol acyltransferase [Paracoccus aminophilus JCM 7686]
MASRYHPRPAGVLGLPRLVIFYLWIALVTLVMGIFWLPVVQFTRMGAHRLGVAWSGQLLLAARIALGVKVEIRGTPPKEACIIAAKHQSFLDILTIAHAVPQCAFIMKRELLRVPIMGYYARKAGCIPIDRAKGSEAMKQIAAEIAIAQARPEGLGQLIIYPEGTRTAPGTKSKYKHGVASIRAATGLPVIPVAVNCGLFWPKKGYPMRPGTAIVEFLPVIAPPAGASLGANPETEQSARDHVTFMRELYATIEGASDALLAEAGGLPAR